MWGGVYESGRPWDGEFNPETLKTSRMRLGRFSDLFVHGFPTGQISGRPTCQQTWPAGGSWNDTFDERELTSNHSECMEPGSLSIYHVILDSESGFVKTWHMTIPKSYLSVRMVQLLRKNPLVQSSADDEMRFFDVVSNAELTLSPIECFVLRLRRRLPRGPASFVTHLQKKQDNEDTHPSPPHTSFFGAVFCTTGSCDHRTATCQGAANTAHCTVDELVTVTICNGNLNEDSTTCTKDCSSVETIMDATSFL
jgi:hypothetical protein